MSDLLTHPLFADFEFLIKFIFVAIVLVLSLIGKLLNSEQPRKAPQRRPIRPQPQQPPQPPAAMVGQQPNRKKLENEIDEFIRRTTKSGIPQARAETSRREKLPAKPVRRAQQKSAQRTEPTRPALTAEVVKPAPRPGSLSQRDSHLAEVIENRDEEMASHLQGVFSHSVGTLAKDSQQQVVGTGSTVSAVTPVTADQLVELFRSPQNIRNAVIMSEILRSPEDRWKS